jgi:hypothetical protein
LTEITYWEEVDKKVEEVRQRPLKTGQKDLDLNMRRVAINVVIGK